MRPSYGGCACPLSVFQTLPFDKFFKVCVAVSFVHFHATSWPSLVVLHHFSLLKSLFESHVTGQKLPKHDLFCLSLLLDYSTVIINYFMKLNTKQRKIKIMFH